MQLTDLARKDRARAGAWHVRTEQTDFGKVRHLYHYSTLMLTWNVDDPNDADVLDYSLGWGSVSDQQGMNRMFRTLGITLRYERSGGNPRIVSVQEFRRTKPWDEYVTGSRR